MRAGCAGELGAGGVGAGGLGAGGVGAGGLGAGNLESFVDAWRTGAGLWAQGAGALSRWT